MDHGTYFSTEQSALAAFAGAGRDGSIKYRVVAITVQGDLDGPVLNFADPVGHVMVVADV